VAGTLAIATVIWLLGQTVASRAITEASSGIGAAFAARLASDGYDLTLVARRRSRLAELSARLTQAVPVTVEVHAADLSDPRGACVRPKTGSRRFAGWTCWSTTPGMARSPGLDAAVAAPIGVHVTAPTRLTRAALPGRDRGAVTNSAASWPVLSASWTEVLDEKPLTSTTR
jgi:uncharacterized protein